MKPTRNLWPLAIILTFVLFISGTIGLVVMASTQRVDLVSKNYYEQELKFQAQIDRSEHARHLSAPAKVAYDRSRRRITLTLPPEHAAHPVTGQIQLYRPSEADLDRQLRLQTDDHGSQSLDASHLKPGLWKIRLSWSVADEGFFSDQQLVITTSR